MKDKDLEMLWDSLVDVPFNENDELEIDFPPFEKGESMYDIWRYFDEKHSKGVAYLLYQRSVE